MKDLQRIIKLRHTLSTVPPRFQIILNLKLLIRYRQDLI